jgi:hypothetical protein
LPESLVGKPFIHIYAYMGIPLLIFLTYICIYMIVLYVADMTEEEREARMQRKLESYRRYSVLLELCRLLVSSSMFAGPVRERERESCTIERVTDTAHVNPHIYVYVCICIFRSYIGSCI